MCLSYLGKRLVKSLMVWVCGGFFIPQSQAYWDIGTNGFVGVVCAGTGQCNTNEFGDAELSVPPIQ